ncbi:IS3 family transposase [Anaerotalea alkaliphila]|uniref:IS3 family transposase n=1 Tax=Anaerotalea alkaliphila TaxID=2662126 RepID=A0A7X5HTV5_9FIRM|nr:IS3 family transposase [Anaerotalea alkaliphila]
MSSSILRKAPELSDYVNWHNNIRIHSSLNYLTPVAFRNLEPKKVV